MVLRSPALCSTELVPPRMDHKGFSTQYSMRPSTLCTGVPEKVSILGDATPHCSPMSPLLGYSSGGQGQHGFASEEQKVFPVQDGPHGRGVERAEELQGGLLHVDPRPDRGG